MKPFLNKETNAIWTAWTHMGNREVAREAVAKGTHVKLAIKFLSSRNEISEIDAETWFKNEVRMWVRELLNRKQIHRSKHILTNAGIDPTYELYDMFLKTTSVEMRTYIGEHFKDSGQIDNEIRKYWCFLEKIRTNQNNIPNIPDCHCIADIQNKSSDWYSKIATILFLIDYDDDLATFVKPMDLFKHLVSTKNEILKSWIAVSFGGIDSHLAANCIFRENPISKEMMNFLNFQLNENFHWKNEILTEFCKHGIFLQDEKKDFLKVVYRIFEYDISSVYDVFQNQSSNINMVEFVKMLNDYCVQNQSLFVLAAVAKYLEPKHLQNVASSHIDMLIDFGSIDWTSHKSIRSNIISTMLYLKNCDYKEYFIRNPLVLCSLLLLNEDIHFFDSLSSRIKISDIDISKYLDVLFSKYNILRHVSNKSSQNFDVKKKTFYNLLEDHSKMKVDGLLEFKYSNGDMPHFNCDNLVQKFGLKENLDNIYYISKLRPSIAAKLVVLTQLRYFIVSENDALQKQLNEVFHLALSNFEDEELSCSSICFQEMIGISSNSLRVHLNVARVLKKAGHNEIYCKDIFMQLEDTLYEVQNILEYIILEEIDKSFNLGKDFLVAKNEYQLVIEFSRENNIKLPEGFLRLCATTNDWLSFMIFAQLENYPLEQIKEILQCFKNPFYLEHVLHCVTYDINIEEENVLMRKRDNRKALLSKIGVRQSREGMHRFDSKSLTRSLSNSASVDTSDILEIDILNTKATLLQTLITCHNSTDPPRALLQACQLYRNPLLAILATSYEPDSIHTNWITWLIVSCELYQNFTNLEGVVLIASNTREILNKSIEKGYCQTVLKSLQIFLPDNPLKYFMEFLCLGVNHIFDQTLMLNYLESFKKSISNYKKSNILSEADHDVTYLVNKCWLEETALMLMGSALKFNFKSAYEQISFLKIMDELKFSNIFSTEMSNLSDILRILMALYKSGSQLWLDLSVIFKPSFYRECIVSCVSNLLEEKLFQTALEVSEIGNIPQDLVLLMKWQDQFENRQKKAGFWEDCNYSFKSHNVTADRVIEFYSKISEKLIDPVEKYEISKYSYKWSRDFQLGSQYVLEKNMWLNFICIEEKHKKFDSLEINPETHLYKEMLEILEQVPICELSLSKESHAQIEKLISISLDRKNLFLALRLEKIFVHENADVEMLKLCCRLAEGMLMPYQLNAKERVLLSKVSNYRRFSMNRRRVSNRLSSFSSANNSPSFATSGSILNNDMYLESMSQDVMAIIQTFSEKLIKGSEIANDILMTYRISINIRIPYHLIVFNPNDVNLLKNALEMDCSNKMEVVHDFIMVHGWNKDQISDLVCQELIDHISYHIKARTEHPIMWDLNLNSEFHFILRMLQDDCSILGHKLFSYGRTLLKAHLTSNNDIKISEMAFIIELMIRSHDCFTADCNMEGISSILNSTQKIVMHLVTLRSWKLIVRLLTAIARYSEMNYVFQILKENEQFEFLLMKGSRHDGALKLALLEYLRRFCPDNIDLYKMVALHFTLFSEVAVLWEKDARSIIKNLIGISKLEMQNNKINPDTEPYVIFTNTDGTRLCLSKAMENYTHATEFHLQGEKLTKAMHTAKQAELLAVQLSLFNGLPTSSTAVCILDLESSQITNLISTQLSFEQSLILVEAFNHQTDWSAVLFNHCIVQNNMVYLEHFLNHLALTETITRDLCKRYFSNYNNISEEGELNMKIILNKLPSVHAKYQIASELGFNDIIEDLITTGQLCYLKDTVWKRGYKTT